MRATTRLLATASRSSTFLRPGAPTGLTGLLTHRAPRSTLLYLYSSTLEKLSHFPESSVYRQSTEALTKHRLNIIENIKPAGLTEWQERVKKIVDEHPEAFRRVPVLTASGHTEHNIVWRASAIQGMQTAEYEDEAVGPPQLEGPRTEEERENQREVLSRDPVEEHRVIPRIEPEPSLTLGQIEEVENAIGAGLIEEVIQVAEGESQLVDTLAEHKVWEDLEESPRAGQWTYFARDTHTPTTQKP
ncbi:hypothetical protein B0A55_02165 [Friedmanniomyces simplex]|uniref:NADH-ubiquinone oxidoreductase 29.9 kDa subunit, mitochondrial n=1 Tax=Friedmanniomyces simplex TaxID=329884 RepID=A0A4U0XY18_9PEZI|nr:hypothetical protein B0A55_02165 [Friedmanniomyces simplex]